MSEGSLVAWNGNVRISGDASDFPVEVIMEDGLRISVLK
jgi:hypothetical protein